MTPKFHGLGARRSTVGSSRQKGFRQCSEVKSASQQLEMAFSTFHVQSLLQVTIPQS